MTRIKTTLLNTLVFTFFIPTFTFASTHSDTKPLRHINLGLNPFWLVQRNPYFDIQIGVFRKVAIGLGFHDYTIKPSSNYREVSYKMSVQYYFNERFTDSWYIAPTLERISDFSYRYGAQDVSLCYTALIGYHWVYDNGFNIRFGIGPSHHNVKDNPYLARGELSFGWAF